MTHQVTASKGVALCVRCGATEFSSPCPHPLVDSGASVNQDCVVVIQMATNALMMWVGLVIFLLLFAILLRMKLEHIESLLNAILKQLPASP